MDKRRCLVLGGGGFLGTNLCRALLERGAHVQAFGRSKSFPAAIDERVIWTSGEFTDVVALAKAVEGQDIVFHLIGGSIPESSNRDPAADLVMNTLATTHLLDICRGEKVRKVIFVSSGGTVYGVPARVPISEAEPTDPISAYGISKLATEKYLALYRHLYGLNYQIFRLANPYGRYQSPHRKQGVVAALIYRALAGEPLEIWGTGDVTRDFIHVTDAIEALLEGVDYTGPHRVMNVGSGVGRTVADVVRDIESVLGGNALRREYREGRAADVPVNVLDIALITRETNWRPRVTWSDGLRDTIDWIASQQF